MYTLNLERSAVGILETAGVLDTSKVPRSLPWRQVPSPRALASFILLLLCFAHG
jgi:hypothetical protein